MKERKVPMRTCLGCGNVFPKKALVRIVKTPDGQVLMDATGKQAGRGAYICRSAECLEKAVKAKRIGRALEAEVGSELIGLLKASMEEQVEPR